MDKEQASKKPKSFRENFEQILNTFGFSTKELERLSTSNYIAQRALNLILKIEAGEEPTSSSLKTLREYLQLLEIVYRDQMGTTRQYAGIRGKRIA